MTLLRGVAAVVESRRLSSWVLRTSEETGLLPDPHTWLCCVLVGGWLLLGSGCVGVL